MITGVETFYTISAARAFIATLSGGCYQLSGGPGHFVVEFGTF